LLSPAQILVAGHLCLDLIPQFKGPSEIEPGCLIEVGPAQFSTGGTVSNVGRSLHRLGVPTRLIGKVGDDPFGQIVCRLLKEDGEHLADDLVISPGGATSYSVVISPPHKDRTFLHMPGENNTFGPEDLHPDAIAGAKLLHFGYPPLMARMYASEGEELEALLAKAKDVGLTVTLDMSLPDPASPSGRAPWKAILKRVLPLVDWFMPSQDELAFMMGRSPDQVNEMMKECLGFGAKTVVVKKGSQGLVAADHLGVSAMQSCFPVQVKGTTGAGDATIAGILYGILQGWTLEKCLESGCAVGAFSVEAADSVSGVKPWSQVEARLAGEWKGA
jgi:sugar/nucleoside kinase (ribokinase family)